MSEHLPQPLGSDQIGALGFDLDKLIDRYVEEFDLPVATIVGVLTMKATSLTLDSFEADDDEEEEKLTP